MSYEFFKKRFQEASWMYEDCVHWIASQWPRATLVDIFALTDRYAARIYMRAFLYETYADYSDKPLHYALWLDDVLFLEMLPHLDSLPFPVWFENINHTRNHLRRAIDYRNSNSHSVVDVGEARYWFDRQVYELWASENALGCPVEGHDKQIEMLTQSELARQERARSRKLGAPYHNRANVPGEHRDMEWNAILAWYGNRCLKCGSTTELCRDHIIPVTWDGATNSYDNIQPLCRTCNTQKLNRNKTDYRPYPLPSTKEALIDWYKSTHAESEATE